MDPWLIGVAVVVISSVVALKAAEKRRKPFYGTRFEPSHTVKIPGGPTFGVDENAQLIGVARGRDTRVEPFHKLIDVELHDDDDGRVSVRLLFQDVARPDLVIQCGKHRKGGILHRATLELARQVEGSCRAILSRGNHA